MSSFSISRSGAGFHIKLKNGYTVSVQFGPGAYSDNYDANFSDDVRKLGQQGSDTAEFAVIDKHGNLIKLPGHDDTVTNRSTPSQLVSLLNWASQLPIGDA